jgi:hypothetical protein
LATTVLPAQQIPASTELYGKTILHQVDPNRRRHG